MSTAAVALRAAIYDALVADAALNALLGGPRVYDEVPRAAAFPYVTLGECRILDWSTGTEPGEEHQLTLHAWSRQGGHAEAHRHRRRAVAGARRRAARSQRLSRWSICVSHSPTSAAKPTGVPITPWCGFAR